MIRGDPKDRRGDDEIAVGDKVVTRWMGHGTHTDERRGVVPINNQVTFTGIAIRRIADGKIVERWVNTDQLGMMRLLGADQ